MFIKCKKIVYESMVVFKNIQDIFLSISNITAWDVVTANKKGTHYTDTYCIESKKKELVSTILQND